MSKKMKFSVDMFYNDPSVPIYEAGKVYDVPDHMVARWLKRGGEIVEKTVLEISDADDLLDLDDTQAQDDVESGAEKDHDEATKPKRKYRTKKP